MRRNAYALSAVLLVMYLGCVVVPDQFEARIYIDIRHIQAQADEALDYVEGKTEALPEIAPVPESSSMLRDTLRFLSPIGTAYAQEMDESSARAQQILKSMRDRHNELEAIKKTGGVGENNRGVVEVVDNAKLGGADQVNAAQQLIAAENNDRKAYYQEIARVNKDKNLNVGTVERVYAQRRLLRAKAGEVFQLPPAGEDFEAFKKSAAGQKLGAEAKADAWVTIK